MGCDIHAMKESRENFWWKNEGEPDIDRDYELFAVLAGVRDRYGIEPVAEPKGVPEDASTEYLALYEYEGADAHTPSYLSLAELKGYDQEMELDDGMHVSSRGPDGSILEVHGCCSREDCAERVGKRKLFGIWDRNPLNDLIAELEELRARRGLTDDDVRICFFFDN